MAQNYFILRLNHRIERDKRLTTHVALTGRAFGAKGFIYTGEPDKKLERSITSVHGSWGDETPFEVVYWDDWVTKCHLMKRAGAMLIHLTMYGVPIQEADQWIASESKKRPVFFVVGGAKVPPEVYRLCDLDVSVTGQPHSEVAALAVTLDRCYQTAIETEFPNASRKVK